MVSYTDEPWKTMMERYFHRMRRITAAVAIPKMSSLREPVLSIQVIVI
jgi:hypothetical protein